MNLAQIENGTVVNIIVVDPADVPEWAQDWPVADDIGIGWTVTDDGFSPPPGPTPDELRAQMPPLTRRQFWLGANSLGLSKADIMAATNDPIILIEIEESGEFHRTYESILMLSGVLGITPEQLDDVWMWWASA